VRDERRLSYQLGALFNGTKIQSPIAVAGYQGFTYDNGVSALDAANGFVNSKIRLLTKNDEFTHWGPGAWNAKTHVSSAPPAPTRSTRTRTTTSTSITSRTTTRSRRRS
jgi:hypothetical protein